MSCNFVFWLSELEDELWFNHKLCAMESKSTIREVAGCAVFTVPWGKRPVASSAALLVFGFLSQEL
jgi:hypothetical protein